MRIFLVVWSLVMVPLAYAIPILHEETNVTVRAFSQRLDALVEEHGADNIVWVSDLHGVLTNSGMPWPKARARGDMPEVVRRFTEAGGHFIISSADHNFAQVLGNIQQLGLLGQVGLKRVPREITRHSKKKKGGGNFDFYRAEHVISVRAKRQDPNDPFLRAKHMAIEFAKDRAELRKKTIVIFTEDSAGNIGFFKKGMRATRWYQQGARHVYTYLLTPCGGACVADDYLYPSRVPKDLYAANLSSDRTESTASGSDYENADGVTVVHHTGEGGEHIQHVGGAPGRPRANTGDFPVGPMYI